MGEPILFDMGAHRRPVRSRNETVNWGAIPGLVKDVERQAAALHPQYVWEAQPSEDGSCIHLWPLLPEYIAAEVWVFHTKDIQHTPTRRAQVAKACDIMIDTFRLDPEMESGKDLILPVNMRGEASPIK